MTDGIIKGTGNSRKLRSVANFLQRYPTYEDFARALMAGILPVDFNGINAEGWATVGTKLNKANLVKDSTAAAFGLDAAATPDTMFAQVPTAKMLWRMMEQASVLAQSALDDGDYIAVDDASANTTKRVAVQELRNAIVEESVTTATRKVGESTFQKLITGKVF